MRRLRIICQLLFLFFFLLLLLLTFPPLKSFPPANLFLRGDPFLALLSLAGGRALLAEFIPALIIVGFTLVLGRFFCSWICPLGTTLDIFHRFLPGKKRNPDGPSRPGRRMIKYYALFILVILGILGIQAGGWLDPICIATRGVGMVLLPFLHMICKGILDGLLEVDALAPLSDTLYAWLESVRIIEPVKPIYSLQWLFLAMAAAILLLQWIERRFWCRSLCPLGALLGLFSSFRLLRPVIGENCTQCGACERKCPTGAIQSKRIHPGECILCFNCIDLCPFGTVSFSPGRERSPVPLGEVLAARRTFLKSAAAAGLLLYPLSAFGRAVRSRKEFLIRPPGSLPEEEFLDHCIRCGECMKVCPTRGLQPALLESGWEAMFTPCLIPRISPGPGKNMGYCEYSCNACGKVCPTRAIAGLSLEKKQKFKMGTAYFDRSKCIPWVQNVNCIVCEEHCPTPQKSIRTLEYTIPPGEPRAGEVVKRPYVVPELCIGCGICETKCPVQGEAAIRVHPLQVNLPEIRSQTGR